MTREQMKTAMAKMQVGHQHLAELAGVRVEAVRAHDRGDSVSVRDIAKIKNVFTKFGIKIL